MVKEALVVFFSNVELSVELSTVIPWGIWIEPLLWWLLFMAAFYLVVVCMMVILRRQWMDHERLLYPLTQVPLGMVEDGKQPGPVKPFLKNASMWLGLAVLPPARNLHRVRLWLH